MASVRGKRQAGSSTRNSPGDRLAAYRFKPGQSGNPLGRPKNDNLAAHIRDSTDGGKELCDRIIGIFREPDLSRREVVECATWLADRGFAKPKPIEDEDSQRTMGLSLVTVLLSMPPEFVRELNMKLIAASGGEVVDVPSEEVK